MPKHENEVKIAVADLVQLRRTLRRLGYQVYKPRVLENNIQLDDEQGSIRARNLLLRVRSAGKTVTCTFKGRELPGPHKRREEIEFHTDSMENCLAVFAGLGFRPSFRYEKYRTEFLREGDPGTATVDETPIGNFMELEGPVRWLDRAAKELGYSRADYIPASYSRLYAQWCESDETSPPDAMTWSRHR